MTTCGPTIRPNGKMSSFDDVFKGGYLNTSGAPVDGVVSQIVTKTAAEGEDFEAVDAAPKN